MIEPAAPARVLFVDQSGEIGGAELSLFDIVRRRPSDRVCLFSEGPFAVKLRQATVDVVIYQGPPLVLKRHHALMAIFRALPNLVGIAKFIVREAAEYDIVYANTLKAFTLAAISKPFHRKKVVWHLRDLLTDEHFSPLLYRGLALLAKLSRTFVVANSNSTLSAYRDAGGGEGVVVYNGIDAAPFHKMKRDEAKARLLDELLLSDSVSLIGAFGRISRWKGQHIVLEAIESIPSAHLLIVGAPLFDEGEYDRFLRGEVERLQIADRVHFLGFRSDIPELMAAVDVVVHSSIAAEPFGRVIVEGMLAETPVIATSAGGAAELIDSGRTGLLTDPGSVEQLRAALLRLTVDRDLRESISREAKNDAVRRFDLASQCALIDKFIEEKGRL